MGKVKVESDRLEYDFENEEGEFNRIRPEGL